MIKTFNYLFIYVLFCALLLIGTESFSQIIDKDTSDVVIRKTKKEKPTEYNISDVIIKLNKEQTKYVIRVDLDIPLKTTLKLSVSDTSGNTIMYLINDQTLSSGVYRIRWDMAFADQMIVTILREDIYVNLKQTSLFFKEIFILSRLFVFRKIELWL